MDYQDFKSIVKIDLPINRKERFYTGTVLPSLLFHGGLSNLYSFLHQIKGFPSSVNENNTKDNFLFYTEYNLKESAGSRSVGAKIYTVTRDTPDLVIQILKPERIFIVIEAKMFSKVTHSEFNSQMRAQKSAVIDILQILYRNSKIFHVALLPQKLGLNKTSDDAYEIVFWEYFLNNGDLRLEDNYFLNYLRFALENYKELVSEHTGRGSTIQDLKQGCEIFKDGKANRIYWVGRGGGRKSIENDVRNNLWENKLYGINAEKPKDGRLGNWITCKEFAQIVDSVKLAQ